MKSAKRKSPRERFVSIVERRVNFTLDCIGKLSRFAVRSNYVASEKELESIIIALRQKVDDLEKIYKTGKDSTGGFKLPQS